MDALEYMSIIRDEVKVAFGIENCSSVTIIRVNQSNQHEAMNIMEHGKPEPKCQIFWGAVFNNNCYSFYLAKRGCQYACIDFDKNGDITKITGYDHARPTDPLNIAVKGLFAKIAEE